MSVADVLIVVKRFFTEQIAVPYKIPSVELQGDGWEATVEVIEEKEYMISHAKDELIGVYKVQLNSNLEVVSFTRVELRERSALVGENQRA